MTTTKGGGFNSYNKENLKTDKTEEK